jgi:hypothetical protein
MAYLEQKHEQARALLGKRVEIPVHYDLWMQGARCGVVSSIGKDGEFIRVRLDHPQVKKLAKIWRIDFDYMKIL